MFSNMRDVLENDCYLNWIWSEFSDEIKIKQKSESTYGEQNYIPYLHTGRVMSEAIQ